MAVVTSFDDIDLLYNTDPKFIELLRKVLRGTRNKRRQAVEFAVASVRKTPQYHPIYIRWIEHVFQMNDREDRTKIQGTVPTSERALEDSDALTCFVNCLVELFRGDKVQAGLIASQERERRGFQYQLPVSTKKPTATVPSTPGKRAGQASSSIKQPIAAKAAEDARVLNLHHAVTAKAAPSRSTVPNSEGLNDSNPPSNSRKSPPDTAGHEKGPIGQKRRKKDSYSPERARHSYPLRQGAREVRKGRAESSTTKPRGRKSKLTTKATLTQKANQSRAPVHDSAAEVAQIEQGQPSNVDITAFRRAAQAAGTPAIDAVPPMANVARHGRSSEDVDMLDGAASFPPDSRSLAPLIRGTDAAGTIPFEYDPYPRSTRGSGGRVHSVPPISSVPASVNLRAHERDMSIPASVTSSSSSTLVASPRTPIDLDVRLPHDGPAFGDERGEVRYDMSDWDDGEPEVDEVEDENPMVVGGSLAESSSDRSSSRISNLDEALPAGDSSNSDPCAKAELPENIRPLLWAQSRQAVCESFHWFRSYQSGVYHTKGVALGYLLSAFSAQRDIFAEDGKLIVSHGGGGSKVVRTTAMGLTIITGDQRSTDHSVNALLSTYREGRPIVLLADDKYKLFPYNLGKYTYVVLGYYWIKYAWAEVEKSANERGECVRYKFAFQWCEGQSAPWWLAAVQNFSNQQPVRRSPQRKAPSSRKEVNAPTIYKLPTGTTTSEEVSCVHPELSQLCNACDCHSVQIFSIKWTCLNASCAMFWDIDENVTASCLNFHEGFFKPQGAPPASGHVSDPFPRAPVHQVGSVTKSSSKLCHGFHCSKCGQLCSREKWECWECTECQYQCTPTAQYHTHKEFWSQEKSLSFKNYKIHPLSKIKYHGKTWTDANEKGFIYSFTFPDNRGCVHVITSETLSNVTADRIFNLYQRQAHEQPFFRRYPLQTHGLRGRMLANYFSHNAGAPYKYVADTGSTVTFDDAPSAVRAALGLIKKRAAIIAGAIDFNEILSVAYMERQKMSFHSDSEPGLGPVVSSLSLGSTATMHFRLQNAFRPRDVQRHIDLSVILRHGDVLVMEGADIQNMYEHTVVPKNFRIAATARLIAT